MKTPLILFLITICFHLSFGQTPKLVLPIGHNTKWAWTASYSPNGKYIVTASYDNTAKIWDVQRGKLLHSLEGHTNSVKTACYSPDGKIIATASTDKTAKIWDAFSGKLLKTLGEHPSGLINATFSPNGKMIVTSSGSVAKIWDVESGKLQLTLDGSESNFSPDSKRIISTSMDSEGLSRLYSAKVWDIESGKLLYTVSGHTDHLNYVDFSPDGKYIVTASKDHSAKLWASSNGNLLQVLNRHSGEIKFACFSPDSKSIVTASNDGTAIIWDMQSGELLQTLTGHKDEIIKGLFSFDGRNIITGSADKSAKVWDAQSGKLIHTLEGHKKGVLDVNLNPTDRTIVTTSIDGTVKIWDVVSGKILTTLTGMIHGINDARYNPDGKSIIISSDDMTAKIFDIQNGRVIKILEGHEDDVERVDFSPNGNSVVTSSWDGTAKIWDLRSWQILATLTGSSIVKYSPDGTIIVTSAAFDTNDYKARVWDAKNGKLIHGLDHEDDVENIEFSPDRKTIATLSDDKKVKVWDLRNGKLIHDLGNESAEWIEFSPDGKSIITISVEGTAKIWDFQNGKLIYNLAHNDIESLEVSSDGKTIATVSDYVKLWDMVSGNLIHTLRGDVLDLSFSPDGNSLVTTTYDERIASIWDVRSGRMRMTLTGSDSTSDTFFSPDSKMLVTISRTNTVKTWNVYNGNLISSIILVGGLSEIVWESKIILSTNEYSVHVFDLYTGMELIGLTLLGEKDFIITHPSGLFDASPGAMEKLYFVQGMDIIDFAQLKERYYEPGLWKKVMAGEKLRSVAEMKSIALPPDIQVGQVDDKGYLNINLTNRGGGIGEVNLFVNGKEVIKDARDAKVKPDAPNATIKVFVGKHKSIVKGQVNFIAVKAWNKDHWVQSRGQVVSYQSKEIESYKPAVHILTCGVSDYTGNEIDLKYAAKDANDVSTALQLGAKKLFGAERSYVYNLTTTQATEFYPTKTNILKAFEKISATAHPLDIFVMYVSGHGINYGGQDGDWHYLTQEAYTGSGAAYNDPAIRAQTTISSNELVELFKKVPALKQVLMLDACASGKVVDNLIAQKDIESSTLRALDRMRDRTGMHIITGCTADAVSYEASKYGQGVLTYSLLEGIRGAALREDQYVDVNKLFQYAQDRVPQLAEGIGGIQSPQVFSPQGSQSFDIGILGEAEKKGIPIAKIKPVYIRSNFQDENEMEDVLGIGKAVDESLNDVSSKGVDASLIFVDVREYPDGCKLTGRYKKENGQIILKLRKKCGADDKTFDLKAGGVEALKLEILKVL
jgi:WD40 repeat protein